MLALWWSLSTVPMLGDPAMLWAGKAAAFQVTDALDLRPLGAGESLLLVNPSHPIGFPLLMWQATAWLATFEPQLCRLPAVFFLVMTLVLIDRGLRESCASRWRWLPVASLGLLPVVLAQGYDGHADLMLGAFLLGVVLACEPQGSAVTAGLLAGGCALTKLEGLTAVPLGLLLLAGQRRWRSMSGYLLAAAVPGFSGWWIRPDTGPLPAGPQLHNPLLYLDHFGELVRRMGLILEHWIHCVTAWPLSAALICTCLVVAPLLPSGRLGRRYLGAATLWLMAIAGAYLLHPSFEIERVLWQPRVHGERALLQVLPCLWLGGWLAVAGRRSTAQTADREPAVH
jgi:hypothetical protein